jgi:hypothetical protein
LANSLTGKDAAICFFGRLFAMHTRLLLILLFGVVAGCGSDSPFDYEKVSGKVTYDDGSSIPAGGMQLRFQALDAPKLENAFPRPAVANVNGEGVFDCVTSYKYGDGLIPGRHKVAIALAPGPGGKLLVPKEYSSVATTPLEIDTANSPLEIKVPKPKGN